MSSCCADRRSPRRSESRPRTLRRLERFWIRAGDLAQRPRPIRRLSTRFVIRLEFLDDAAAAGLRVCPAHSPRSRPMPSQPPPLAATRPRAERRRRARPRRYRGARRRRRADDHQQSPGWRRPRPVAGRRGAASRRGARHRLSPHPDYRGDPDRAAMSMPLRPCWRRPSSRSSLHCRSGTRSTLLWALARLREGADPSVLIAEAARHGIDIAALPALAARLG